MAITSKEINLFQLDQELGGEGLVADFNNPDNKIIKAADNASYSEEQIETAIAAHIAQPTPAQVIALNKEQGMIKLRELGFTEEQISALFGA